MSHFDGFFVLMKQQAGIRSILLLGFGRADVDCQSYR